MGSKAHTSPRGKATTSRGKSSLIALCLAVLFCLYLNVANSVFSSNFGRGEKETAAASGDFASTRLAENSIRTGGDYDDDDDDVGNDVGGEGSGQTMRTTIGHEGSLDAVDQTATAAAVGGDYELAASESHGFFYDVSADSWNLLRDIYLKHDNHRDPSRPLLYSEHDPKSDAPWDKSAAAWYQNNYEPNFSCMFEKRIGGMRMNGDGPKWVRAHRHYYVTLSIGSAQLSHYSFFGRVCLKTSFKVCDPHRIRKLALERKARDPNNRGCVVYSIGSNGDFNFELGMQVRNVRIRRYHFIFLPSMVSVQCRFHHTLEIINLQNRKKLGKVSVNSMYSTWEISKGKCRRS